MRNNKSKKSVERGTSVGEKEGAKTMGSFGVGKNEMQVKPELDPIFADNKNKVKKVISFGSPNYDLRKLAH